MKKILVIGICTLHDMFSSNRTAKLFTFGRSFVLAVLRGSLETKLIFLGLNLESKTFVLVVLIPEDLA